MVQSNVSSCCQIDFFLYASLILCILVGQNVAKRQEMHDRMMYHGALLVAADAASSPSSAVKDFKISEEVHPLQQQHDLHQQGLKKEEKEDEKKKKEDEKKKKEKDEKKKKEEKGEKTEFKHAAHSAIELAVVTKAKESIETHSVFDASTTSFFKGYGIAAGHGEDEFGGLGLIGVYESHTSDGIKKEAAHVYFFLFIILTSWFLFHNITNK